MRPTRLASQPDTATGFGRRIRLSCVSRSFAAQPARANADPLPPRTPCRCEQTAAEDDLPAGRKRRTSRRGKGNEDFAIRWQILSPGGAPILE